MRERERERERETETETETETENARISEINNHRKAPRERKQTSPTTQLMQFVFSANVPDLPNAF